MSCFLRVCDELSPNDFRDAAHEEDQRVELSGFGSVDCFNQVDCAVGLSDQSKTRHFEAISVVQ